MAKVTSALLVLALIAIPFLQDMEAAQRTLPRGRKDDDNKKTYRDEKFGWRLLPFILLHHWLFGPFWWLKDGKATTPNPKASYYYHDTHKVPKVGSAQVNFASP